MGDIERCQAEVAMLRDALEATRQAKTAELFGRTPEEWLDIEAERNSLRGAVHRGDWFRQAWANANGCSVEEAERAFETLGDITAKRGQ